MAAEQEKLHKRIDRIEQENEEQVITLVEILSNATFFGEIKKANCKFAKNGQCEFYVLTMNPKGKLPLSSECRIDGCKESRYHYHIELSNLTCSFCQITGSAQHFSSLKTKLKESQ